jgi:hypothetical protein
MLTKPYTVTVIPSVPGVPGSAESLVCTPAPPVIEPGSPSPVPSPGSPSSPPPTNSGGGTTLPSGSSASGGTGQLIYLYVPNNPSDPAAGEVRTPYISPAPAGYTCQTGIFYLPDPIFPGAVTPVYETRGYWTYP